MARTAGFECIEKKIEKAQINVVKTKQKYDAAVVNLADFMDKRDALRRDELVATIMKSNKSYEEIIRFLNDADGQDE